MATRLTGVYTQEQRDEIIAHVLCELASGRPVRRILDEDDGMPAPSQFWRWVYVEGSEELQSKVARARGDGMEALLDEALVIADTPQIGTIVKSKPQVDKESGDVVGEIEETTREDMLAHRKLQIETRIKMAQMLKPKTYSPKLDVTSGGESINFAAQLEAARRRAEQGDQPASE